MRNVRDAVRTCRPIKGSSLVPGYYSWGGRFSVIVEALCDEVREQ